MKKFNRRFLSLALAFLFIITPFCLSVSAVSFPDVPDTHWAKDYIQELVDLKVIDGCPDGTYKPEEKVLTCEFIKMIVCAYDEDYRSDIESIEVPKGSHWAKRYVKASGDRFFNTKNYESDEALNKKVTRIEAAQMAFSLFMWRNENDDDRNHFDRSGEYIKDLTDINSLTETQKNVVNSVIAFGIMKADGAFRPNETLTRAEAAEIIYLAVKN